MLRFRSSIIQDRSGNQNRQKLELKNELKMETIVRQVISLNITTWNWKRICICSAPVYRSFIKLMKSHFE